MVNKRFKKELEMIENALQDEQSKDDFREYMRPLVEDIADKFMASDQAQGMSREKLIEAGWTYFDLALRKYKEKIESIEEQKNDSYYFGTYFTWFVRQGIVEYLKSMVNSR